METAVRILWVAAICVATVPHCLADEIELSNRKTLTGVLAISSDGKFAFSYENVVTGKRSTGGKYKPTVTELKSGTVVKELEWNIDEWRRPIDAVFSPDGKKILVIHDANGSYGGKLFDLETGEMVFNLRHDLSKLAVFSPDSQRLLSSGESKSEDGGMGAVLLWDLANRKRTAMSGPIHAAKAIAIAPNGKFAAATDFGVKPVAYVCNTGNGKIACELVGHTKDLAAVAFSADSKMVATGDSDGEIRLWAIPSGKPVADFDDHQAAVISLAFHPKRNLLASSGGDGTIKIFDVAKKKVVSTTKLDKMDYCQRLEFTDDGEKLIARESFYSKGLALWNVKLSD